MTEGTQKKKPPSKKKAAACEALTLDDIIDRIASECGESSSLILIIGDKDNNTFSLLSSHADEEYTFNVLDAAAEHVFNNIDKDSYVKRIKSYN